MELREKYEKENGHNVYAYRQDYAGARPYQDGFNDEYVEWLESKVKNLSLCAVSQRSELLPKRLSNRAYRKAKTLRYEEFVKWWDEQV
jgi:hypothetical protein